MFSSTEAENVRALPAMNHTVEYLPATVYNVQKLMLLIQLRSAIDAVSAELPLNKNLLNERNASFSLISWCFGDRTILESLLKALVFKDCSNDPKEVGFRI